jgi:hypothetical protein
MPTCNPADRQRHREPRESRPSDAEAAGGAAECSGAQRLVRFQSSAEEAPPAAGC